MAGLVVKTRLQDVEAVQSALGVGISSNRGVTHSCQLDKGWVQDGLLSASPRGQAISAASGHKIVLMQEGEASCLKQDCSGQAAVSEDGQMEVAMTVECPDRLVLPYLQQHQLT